MNYRKKNYRGKRSYSGRPHRRAADSYHQPLPPDQTRIPYTRHTLTKPDIEAVVDALLSGTLTQGRELERFESLLAKLTHSEFAIGFSSGTAAIHSAMACLKLEPEDEVIIPTLTFSSVANMVRMVGATPILVDCDPITMTLSVDAALAAVNENTKAIFTNNFGGHPSDLLAFREICDEHNLLLLEDACHGLGGKYRGHYVGNQADLTCFSFHPSKAITTCEGGAVTTNNRAIAEWLRQYRHHGIQKDPRFFQSNEDMPDYYQELQFQGMNYRLSEVHAALGRSQLTRLDRHIERRRAIAQVYYQKLGAFDEITLPFVAEWADSAFHLFPIQFTGALEGHRDEIYKELKGAGIDVQVHYVPLHRMPMFSRDWKPRNFPNAEAYFNCCLSLPLYPDLSFKDLERITEALTKCIGRYLENSSDEEAEEMPEEEAGQYMEAPPMEHAMEPEPRAPEPEPTPEPEAIVEPEPEPVAVEAEMPEPVAEVAEEEEEEEEEEAPKKPAPRKRATPRPRKPKAKAEDSEDETAADSSDDAEVVEKKPVRKRTTRKVAKEVDETSEGESTEADAEPKPRKRVTRARKPAAKKAEEATDDAPAKPVRRRAPRKKVEEVSPEPTED